MRYTYHDLILETLYKKAQNNINKNTIDEGEIIIGQVLNGTCNFQEKDADTLHITITYGSILNIRDKDDSELGIDFTVYELAYPMGLKNQILFYIDIE